jgi:hypothetical protein
MGGSLRPQGGFEERFSVPAHFEYSNVELKAMVRKTTVRLQYLGLQYYVENVLG